jgi:hypothetical protein
MILRFIFAFIFGLLLVLVPVYGLSRRPIFEFPSKIRAGVYQELVTDQRREGNEGVTK